MAERKTMEEVHGLGRRYDAPEKVTPPNNLAAEAALLGAILFANGVAEEVWAHCHPDDFYAPAHKWIARKCKAMIDAGLTADGVTLREAAEQEQKLVEIGGPKYLIDLLDAAAFGPEVRDYARIVAELSVRRRLITSLAHAQGLALQPPDGMTARELIEMARAGVDDVEDACAYVPETVVSAEAAIGAWLDKLEEHAARGTKPPAGISTGLRELDKVTGRWQAGELIILAGRPSMGKTALAANIAQAAKVRDERGNEAPARVGFLSLEMHAEPLAMRWAASSARKAGLGKVNYSLAREGRLGRSEIAVLREGWRRMPKTTVWETRGRLSLDEVRITAKAIRRMLGGLDLLVIDYLQIMRIVLERGENRASAVGDVTSGLKALAKELGIPILCLSQLSRAVESRDDKRPQLADLRDSGSIEQDADIVLFAYRDEYYLERNEPQSAKKEKWAEWRAELEDAKGKLEAIAGKVRMGSVGIAVLHFEPESDTVVDDKRELKEETLV